MTRTQVPRVTGDDGQKIDDVRKVTHASKQESATGPSNQPGLNIFNYLTKKTYIYLYFWLTILNSNLNQTNLFNSIIEPELKFKNFKFVA